MKVSTKKSGFYLFVDAAFGVGRELLLLLLADPRSEPRVRGGGVDDGGNRVTLFFWSVRWKFMVSGDSVFNESKYVTIEELSGVLGMLLQPVAATSCVGREGQPGGGGRGGRADRNRNNTCVSRASAKY